MEDGAPERAAFQWYHDHRLDNTARNIWRGLAGMWIIDDEVDRALPLPLGPRDLPLMITDRSFKADNQLTNPFVGFAHAPNDGVTGKLRARERRLPPPPPRRRAPAPAARS